MEYQNLQPQQYQQPQTQQYQQFQQPQQYQQPQPNQYSPSPYTDSTNIPASLPDNDARKSPIIATSFSSISTAAIIVVICLFLLFLTGIISSIVYGDMMLLLSTLLPSVVGLFAMAYEYSN